MEKSNITETMKVEILKGIENNIEQNNLHEAISGLMELKSLGIKRVNEMISMYKKGELAGIDLIDNYDNINPNSYIKTLNKLEDDKFYEVFKAWATNDLVILEINQKELEERFEIIKNICCPKQYTSMSKDEFLKELAKFKNVESIGINVVHHEDNREDQFGIEKSELWHDVKGCWCCDLIQGDWDVKMFKYLKTVGKKFYDLMTKDGTIITGIEVFNYKEA
jgi:predicted amino acid-binding ACT domain protein